MYNTFALFHSIFLLLGLRIYRAEGQISIFNGEYKSHGDGIRNLDIVLNKNYIFGYSDIHKALLIHACMVSIHSF